MNQIGDDGAIALAGALKANTVLMTLNLEGMCLIALAC